MLTIFIGYILLNGAIAARSFIGQPIQIFSIVLGALIHPFFQYLDFILGQTSVHAKRHLDGGMGASFDQLNQDAGKAVTWLDDSPELGTLHQALVGAHIQPAFLVALPSGLVTIQTIVVDDWEDIILVADFSLPLCRRSQRRKRKHRKDSTAQQQSDFHISLPKKPFPIKTILF
jgi:hypothetical protein